jgi:hypothetical protein
MKKKAILRKLKRLSVLIKKNPNYQKKRKRCQSRNEEQGWYLLTPLPL